MTVYNCTSNVVNIYSNNQLIITNGRFYLNNPSVLPFKTYNPHGIILQIKFNNVVQQTLLDNVTLNKQGLILDSPSLVLNSNPNVDTYIVSYLYLKSYQVLTATSTITERKFAMVGTPVYNNTTDNTLVGYTDLVF